MRSRRPSDGNRNIPIPRLPLDLVRDHPELQDDPSPVQLTAWLERHAELFPLDRLVHEAPSMISAGAPISACLDCGLVPVVGGGAGKCVLRCSCHLLSVHSEYAWRLVMRWNRSKYAAKPGIGAIPFFRLSDLSTEDARAVLRQLLGYFHVEARKDLLRYASNSGVFAQQLEHNDARVEWCRYGIDLCDAELDAELRLKRATDQRVALEEKAKDRQSRRETHQRQVEEAATRKAGRKAAKLAQKQEDARRQAERRAAAAARAEEAARAAALKKAGKREIKCLWPIPEIKFTLPDHNPDECRDFADELDELMAAAE